MLPTNIIIVPINSLTGKADIHGIRKISAKQSKTTTNRLSVAIVNQDYYITATKKMNIIIIISVKNYFLITPTHILSIIFIT